MKWTKKKKERLCAACNRRATRHSVVWICSEHNTAFVIWLANTGSVQVVRLYDLRNEIKYFSCFFLCAFRDIYYEIEPRPFRYYFSFSIMQRKHTVALAQTHRRAFRGNRINTSSISRMRLFIIKSIFAFDLHRVALIAQPN